LKGGFDMARTALTYSTISNDGWDYMKNKMVKRITARGYDFTVTGCKSEKEERAYLDSFVAYLLSEVEYDARCNGFGTGNHYTDKITGEKVEETYLYLGVRDTEQKEDIKDCYDQWKKEIKPLVRW